MTADDEPVLPPPRGCEVCGKPLKPPARAAYPVVPPHVRTCGQRCRKRLSRREQADRG